MRMLSPLEIGEALDRLAEPAGHLHAHVVQGEGHDVERLVNLLPEVEPAAVVEPGHVAQKYELAAFISTTPEATASDMAATLAMNDSGLPGPTV